MMELRNSDMTEYHWNSVFENYIYIYIFFYTIITCTSVLVSNILKYFKRRGRTMYSSIYFIIKKKIILKIEEIYKYDNLTFRHVVLYKMATI